MKSARNCEKCRNTLVRTNTESLNLRVVYILIKFCIFLKIFFNLIFLYQIGVGVEWSS